MAYVVVSGLPGAGKSSVAQPLSRALALPLISKDVVKEAMAATVDEPTVTVIQSRQLSAAAFEVVFALAAEAPGAVLEASWHPDRGRERLLALPGTLIEVHCSCPPDIARRRYVERAGQRHAVHLDSTRFDDAELWSPTHARPLQVSDPVLDVDCTEPVDIETLTGEVRSHPAWDVVA